MNNKIKVIFISGMKTEDSTGEFTQIKTFISNLDDSIGYFILLKKTDYFHFSYENVEFYENEYELRNFITNFTPDIIILSEIQHISKFFLEYLYISNIPIATFDSIGLSKILYNHDSKVIYLKNCPLNDPKPNDRFNKYWFSAKDALNVPKKSIETKYNIKNGSKKVFFSISKWQYANTLNLNLSNYYKYLTSLIMKALILQDKDISLFLICPIKGLHNVIAEKSKLKTYFFESLEFENYNELLYNSDLVISDNISQISLSKAFINGINTLSIINTKEDNFMNIYKFNMFPYNLPKLELLYSYEYCKLLTKAEAFDENDMIEKISLLLNKNINNHIDYIKECNKLLSPQKIIEEIVKENY